MPGTNGPRDKMLATIQDRIWNGTIPVAFYLHRLECVDYDEMDPYIVNVSRLSYFPSLLPKLHRFFKPKMILSSSPEQGWLSVNDSPLLWHYPAGLLFDVYSSNIPPDRIAERPARPREQSRSGQERAHSRSRHRSVSQPRSWRRNTSSSTDPPPPPPPTPPHLPRADQQETVDSEGVAATLPWKITIRFQGRPPSTVPLDTDLNMLYDVFWASYKQASYCRHQTSRVARMMSPDHKAAIWTGLQELNASQFFAAHNSSINQSVFPVWSVPVRVLVPHVLLNHARTPRARTSTTADKPAKSTSRPTREDDEAVHFPHSVVVVVTPAKIIPNEGTAFQTGPLSAPFPPKWPSQTVGTALHKTLPTLFPSPDEAELVMPMLHGADISLSAPLDELGQYACYPDGWLSLTLRMV